MEEKFDPNIPEYQKLSRDDTFYIENEIIRARDVSSRAKQTPDVYDRNSDYDQKTEIILRLTLKYPNIASVVEDSGAYSFRFETGQNKIRMIHISKGSIRRTLSGEAKIGTGHQAKQINFSDDERSQISDLIAKI